MRLSSRRGALLLGVLVLGCAPPPDTLPLLHDAHDWQNEDGARLATAYSRGARHILQGLARPDDTQLLGKAGYACIYGEAHQEYPDPTAQCTRSFATRSCQLDWEIYTSIESGRVDHVEANFTRDCVGTDRDWPSPKESAIDDQLAPPNLPPVDQ